MLNDDQRSAISIHKQAAFRVPQRRYIESQQQKRDLRFEMSMAVWRVRISQ
jgi:hypothetical protein